MANPSSPRLQRIVARLHEQRGRQTPPPANTAFALVLWEKVAYLAPDERRAQSFEKRAQRMQLSAITPPIPDSSAPSPRPSRGRARRAHAT